MSQCHRNRWHTQICIILRWFKKGTIYKDVGGVLTKLTGFHRRTLPNPSMAEMREGTIPRTRESCLGKCTLRGTKSCGRGCLRQPWKEGAREIKTWLHCLLLFSSFSRSSYTLNQKKPESEEALVPLGKQKAGWESIQLRKGLGLYLHRCNFLCTNECLKKVGRTH